ncbi:MAG TPA: class F sortase [Mycobacteriales bacterium]|nr:class F sortase [Mycobacteriales bacterium]
MLPAPPPAPRTVAVPRLAVSAALVEVGLAADRTLEVPPDADVPGWWSGGARPGEPGPVVVVGHVDSRTGPGVFARLSDLRPGDLVALGLEDGGTASYSVTEVRAVPKAGFPTLEVFGAEPGDVLRLITCGGAFDRASRSYAENVVVTAVRR